MLPDKKLINISEVARRFLISNSDPNLAGKSISAMNALGVGINDAFAQTSLTFPSTSSVVFVKNSSTLGVTDYYLELPKIDLTKEEYQKVNEAHKRTLKASIQKVKEYLAEKNPMNSETLDEDLESLAAGVEAVKAEEDKEDVDRQLHRINDKFKALIKTLPKGRQDNLKDAKLGIFFNGDHVLAKDIFYDPDKNQVLIEAFRADYVTVSNFPKSNSEHWKLGVISPLIAEKLFLFERNDPWKLWSCPGGFLEAIEGKIDDWVRKTAEKETAEEFLSDCEGKLRILPRAISIEQLSFRSTPCSDEQMPATLPTAEFIVPQRFRSDQEDKLKEIFADNQAPDAHEHTGNYKSIPLDDLNSILKIYELQPSWLLMPILTSALGTQSTGGFSSVARITAEELAEKLLFAESKQEDEKGYKLTPDTPHVSKIILLILERRSLEDQKKVLTSEVLAAVPQDDENFAKIKTLCIQNGLEGLVQDEVSAEVPNACDSPTWDFFLDKQISDSDEHHSKRPRTM